MLLLERRGAPPEFLSRIVVNYVVSGQWNNAARVYENILSSRAKSFEDLRLGILAAEFVGRHDLTATWADEILNASPPGDDVQKANALAWARSMASRPLADPERTVALANAALEKGPPEARDGILNTLGAALHRAGRHREAIAHLNEGIRLRGGVVVPQDHAFLGLARFSLGEFDKARQHASLLSTSKPSPNDPIEKAELELLRSELAGRLLDLTFPKNPFKTTPINRSSR